jgi:hypothetical protein
MPDELRHHVLIQRYSAHVSNAMSENRQSPTGLPSPGESACLMAVLEQDFIHLSSEIADKLSG